MSPCDSQIPPEENEQQVHVEFDTRKEIDESGTVHTLHDEEFMPAEADFAGTTLTAATMLGVDAVAPARHGEFVDGTGKNHISDTQAENWIKSRPNTLTKELIEARIAKVDYLFHPNGRTTICTITLDNGALVCGESHCVDPTNFNKDLGEKYSYERAFEKLWELFGFARLELQFLGKL